MWERLRQLSSLDSAARGFFFRSLLLLPLISFSLRIRGFRATQQALQRFLKDSDKKVPMESSGLANDLQRAQLAARMVNAAARHAWRHSTCLEKSLALWYLLGRQGIASSLRIGARKLDEKFEAHAWVERDGVALGDPKESHRHYAAFDTVLSSLPLEPR